MNASVPPLSSRDALTRVGPGTPMGQLMRQYWLPATMSTELKVDGDPVRLLLLGERLIAFRDSSGRVGVMDHRCPHRCASLFLGRNEQDGIRCVYHGWKFDVTGRCVDMPNVPPEQDFKDRVHAKAYPACERNGLIWVYMGTQSPPPPLPMIEANMAPAEDCVIRFIQRECNWLQALEGDIDTSHFGFLHAGSVQLEQLDENHPLAHTVRNRAPQYRVADTPWGTSYGAYRTEPDGQIAWRIANFLMPCWTQNPNSDFSNYVGARGWIPMDDTHTMVVQITWKKSGSTYSGRPLKNGKPLAGFAPEVELMPNTTDWYGRFRPVARAENDYQIDREAQRRNEIYTGITMVFMQDQAVTESMGGITDHEFEHLGPSDQMVARTRRRLLHAATALRDEGRTPPGASNPEVFWQARSGTFHASASQDWQDAYREHVASAMRVVAVPANG